MFAALKLSKWAEQRVEMRNLKLSLQVKKKSLESSKSRFKRSRGDLSAKKLPKTITATFSSLKWRFES